MTLDPPEHLQRFARYYTARGADMVTLFYDGIPDVHDLNVTNTDLIVCDEPFWKDQFGKRPTAVEDRQRAVYNLHYARTHCDWLLVVDLDEIVFGQTPILEFLDSISRTAEAIRIGSAEAVFTYSDDIKREFSARQFRLPFGKYTSPILSRILYRQNARFFTRGLLGHSIGKQFIRTGLKNLDIDIHHACRNGKKVEPENASLPGSAAQMFLAHFDTISFEHWCRKWDRRLAKNDTMEMFKKREKQQERYLQAKEKGMDAQIVLFKELYCVSPWQIFLLSRLGKLVVCDHELVSEEQPNALQQIPGTDTVHR